MVLAIVPIVVRLSLIPFLPIPVPHSHDEFSYLLAGDTFAHGRLTNPTHPYWVFFDTVHVNQHPTYMSKYPPAQGAALAAGQLLGNPWFGVLLSVGAMCGAVLWALQGFLPPRWALLGGVLVVLRLGIFSYWMNSYWGGAIPAVGGALAIGALPRILRFARLRDALLLGLGVAILANSRPLEGLIFLIPIAGVLLTWLLRSKGPARGLILRRIALPLSTLIIGCGMFIGYYNWRGTGKPTLFPYSVNEQAYLTTPTLFWQKPRPPMRYANAQFEAFYNGWSREIWTEGHVDSLPKAVKRSLSDVTKTTYFLFWPELCVILPALPLVIRDSRVRLLLVQTVLCFLGFLLVPWFQAHYIAPLTATLFALLTQASRHLRVWRYAGRPVGVGITRVVVLSAALLGPFHAHVQQLGHPPPQGIEFRAIFQAQLERSPGSHLVLVRYSDSPNSSLEEWIYNSADIDGAKVVWAREIPGVDSRPLLNYFQGRKFWLVEAYAAPPRLTPYPETRPRELGPSD